MASNNEELATNINTLSQMYYLNSILQEMSDNIILIEEGAAGTIITVSGGSLFQLASQYYGDATQWTTIAQANGLIDPELPSGTALLLTIPPSSGTISGGVLNP